MNKSWTYWIHLSKKVTVGMSSRLCQGNGRSNILVSGCDSHSISYIMDILPILTTDFRTVGKNLRISVDSSEEKRLQILIERSLNCVGCGACLSYCKDNALYLKNGHIAVDQNTCVHCHLCLDASTLKGSCVARHYTPKRATLVNM